MIVDIIVEKEWQALKLGFYWHDRQKRKYTNEPYINHCIAVADIVKSFTNDIDVICAAYLHDILEDTECTQEQIAMWFGERVMNLVLQVTDISKPEDGNRAIRKQIDLEHLAKADEDGQIIKLADLIHNTQSIVKYSKNFSKIYLKEMEILLELLTKGSKELHKRACDVLAQAKRELMIE